MSLYRLADHTCVEPLVNGWGAWWMTVAPVPASLHLHNFHLPLLKAYLQNPGFHARAAGDPSLTGSSFVGIPPERADEVRALLQRSMVEQEDNLRLAEALEEFQSLLLTEAKGQSLEPLYGKLPEPLRGLVELVYDYHNRPSLRVLEPLTYRSRYYKPRLQSLRLYQVEQDAVRPALFTTPRIPEEGQIDWRMPFADPRVDQLFSLDVEPKPLEHLLELLEPDARRETLLPLLTDAAPPPPPAPPDGAARVRYLGHACALIEWKGASILVDPVVGVRPSKGGMSRLSYPDLPRHIDFALVTHNHADHFLFETLLRLRHRLGCLVVPRAHGLLIGDASPRIMARELGFKSVVEVDNYDSLPLPDGEIVATPFLGEHGDLAHCKSSYVIRCGQEKILFAADSACLDADVYRNIRQVLGEISTVFMNTETEGSPLTFTIEALFPKKRDRKMEKNRRCRGSTAAEGLQLLAQLGAKRLYNYAMGLEPWMQFIIGPQSGDDSPRMQESTLLLTKAREQGLSVAERLLGPRDILLQAP